MACLARQRVTNALRASWGAGIDARCTICDAPTEDVLHGLRDCETAREESMDTTDPSSFLG